MSEAKTDTILADRVSSLFPTRQEGSDMDVLRGSMPGKYGSPEATVRKSNMEPHSSESSSRPSIVSQMRASLESSPSTGVVLDLNDVYMSQKAKRVGDHLKKEEAAQQLHNFRNSSPDKTVPTKPAQDKRSESNAQAADRAAAAAYLTQQSNKSSNNHMESSSIFNHAADRAAAAYYLAQSKGKSNESPTDATCKNDTGRSRHVQFTASAIARKEPNDESPSTFLSDTEVAALRATIAQNGGVVTDLDEFYKIQRVQWLEDKRHRNEAAQLLHNYQALVASGGFVDVQEFCREQRAVNVVSELDQEVATEIVQEYQEQMIRSASDKPCPADYKDTDYRAFVFVVHGDHGLLLLHCTHKKMKGPHYQLPGGHVDDSEFEHAASFGGSAQDQLLLAGRLGAARELYEETGVDVRSDLDRLEPAALRSSSECDNDELTCQLENKLYFLLAVSDEDFLSGNDDESYKVKRRRKVTCGPIDGYLHLRLSDEHSSFTFAKDPEVAADMIQKHSGGSGSTALLMSMTRPSQQKVDETTDDAASDYCEASRSRRSVREALEEGEARSTESPSAPVDLLPPPERKGLFSCCFCT